MNINDLMIKENKSIEENNFLIEHNKIAYYGSMASQSVLEMCKAIKNINDNKLYVYGGYNSLEEYTESNFGIKKSQAYNYINLVDKFSVNFFQLNGKIGITKLNLLASLDDENIAQEVVNSMPTDSTTEDFKKTIKELKKQISEKNKELVDLQKEKSDLSNKYEQLEIEFNNVPEAHKKELEEKNEKLSVSLKKIDDLNLQITTLNNQLSEITNSDYIKFTVLFADLQTKFKSALSYIDKLEGSLKDDSRKALFSLLKHMENMIN